MSILGFILCIIGGIAAGILFAIVIGVLKIQKMHDELEELQHLDDED